MTIGVTAAAAAALMIGVAAAGAVIEATEAWIDVVAVFEQTGGEGIAGRHPLGNRAMWRFGWIYGRESACVCKTYKSNYKPT